MGGLCGFFQQSFVAFPSSCLGLVVLLYYCPLYTQMCSPRHLVYLQGAEITTFHQCWWWCSDILLEREEGMYKSTYEWD